MTDLLAILDAAIDSFNNTKDRKPASGPDPTSRSANRENGSKPAENLGSARISSTSRPKIEDTRIQSYDSRTERSAHTSKKQSPIYISLSYTVTGSTGSIEDFRACDSSRSHSRKSSRVDAAEENRHFLADFTGSLAEAVARLDRDQPFGDFPTNRWLQFLADVERFAAAGWASQATALGWNVLDLIGCDPVAPHARLDQQGLLWLPSMAEFQAGERGRRLPPKKSGPVMSREEKAMSDYHVKRWKAHQLAGLRWQPGMPLGTEEG